MDKRLACLLIAITLCFTAYGQRDGLIYRERELEQDPLDEQTFFSCGMNYLTNNVYLGRKDSLALPYLSPFIGYQLFNGVYVKGTLSYALTRKHGHFDLFTLAAGYDRRFGRKILTGVSVEKYFYYKNSPGIKANIKESFDLYCIYENRMVEPQISFTVNHGKSSDYVVGFSLDHDFHFKENRLNIIPSILFNAGSQHYYDDYYLTRILKKDKTFPTKEIVKDAGQIKPLDIELAAKTTYRTKDWFFTLNATYAVPMSAATIKLPTATVTEKLSSSVFLELDICYRHERK